MKILFTFLLFVFSSFHIAYGLGSDLELGLDHRGQLNLSTENRSSEDFDPAALMSLDHIIINHISERMREGGEDRDQFREIGESILNLSHGFDLRLSTDEEKDEFANILRSSLLNLRENHPDLYNNILSEYQRSRGYNFDNAGLPNYCENFPDISTSDLEIFFSEDASDPAAESCFRAVGDYVVNNDLETVSRAMRDIQNESLESRMKDFRARMMAQVAEGILQQRGIYGGLEGRATELYSSCFANQEVHAEQGEVEGFDSFQAEPVVRSTRDEPQFNRRIFEDSFREDFLAAQGTANQDSVSRANLIRSSIESILYQEAIRNYRDYALPPYPSGVNPGQHHCRTELALTRGLVYSGPVISRISSCTGNPVIFAHFTDNNECLEAHNNFVQTAEGRSEFENCSNENSENTTHSEGRMQSNEILSAQIGQAPLLFGRDNQGLGNFYKSPMARNLLQLPGMSEMMSSILPSMQNGLLQFNQNYSNLLAQNNEQLETIIQAAINNSELNEVIDAEITDYQESLDNSLNDLCENEGQNLHHIPELVQSVRQEMVSEVSGPNADRLREQALADTQQIECHLLREYPPRDTGGLHPAIYYLGIGGGIALSFFNPLLGGAALLAVEGANGISTISTTQGQLEDIVATTHAGFSDHERALEARAARDRAIALSVVSVGAELVGLGLLDRALDTARLARAAGVPTSESGERAAALLSRELSQAQREAVERAHLVGAGQPGLDGTPAGVGNYTVAQLREKASILREAGFSPSETRELMEAGIVGLNRNTPAGTQYNWDWGNRARIVPQFDRMAEGQRFRVTSNSGNTYEGDFIGFDANGNISYRDADGTVSLLARSRLNEATLRTPFSQGVPPSTTSFEGMQAGQAFEVTSRSGNTYEGQFLGLDTNGNIRYRGPDGTESTLVRARLDEGSVRFQNPAAPTRGPPSFDNMIEGQPFEVTSRSGNTYSGEFLGLDPNGNIRFREPDGTISLMTRERLDESSVSIPQPIQERPQGPITEPVQPRPVEPVISSDSVTPRIPADQLSQIRGRINPAVLQRADALNIQPSRLYRAPDGTNIYLSERFSLDGREAYVAYVDVNGVISPRIIYKSNSQGIFRLSDGITPVHYGKGPGEDFMSIPPDLQRELLTEGGPSSSNLLTANDIFEFERQANADFGGLGAAHRNNGYETPQVEGVFETYPGSTASDLPSFNIGGGQQWTIDNPATIRLEPNLMPDFSRPTTSYTTTTATSGRVEAEVFQSRDGSLTYTIFRDSEGKVWVSDYYENGASLNSYGIPRRQADLGDLATPRWEYHQQIHPDFRNQVGNQLNGSYGSNWNYVREIPFIQEYYRARGLPIPPRD